MVALLIATHPTISILAGATRTMAVTLTPQAVEAARLSE
jgi:hypothetical protein